MSNVREYDVIVLGGGASGMLAAGKAAERGRRVLLLEKNKELGKKLSITGGGRCNILNAEPDTNQLLSYYGEAKKFLFSPFSQHGMQDSWDFFTTHNLPLTVEAKKRAFPQSMQAPDVTKTLKEYMDKHRVEVRTKMRVDELIVEKDESITVTTKSGEKFRGASVIMAMGGVSHKETGSTGDGFSLLAKLGYTIHQPQPNIVPLTTEDSWVHKLSGTTLSFMKITFAPNQAKEKQGVPGKFSRTGKILFTHFGLSGPLILNSAHKVVQLLKDGPVDALIDLYPDTELSTIRNRVQEVFQQNKNKQLKNIVSELVPAGMAEAVVSLMPEELAEKRIHSVSKEERLALADCIKGMPLTINGTMGYEWAVISDGGIDLEEVDTRTMRLKKYPNLFVTGDMLHVNRPSGGYSLQLCWTTGWVAGSHA